MDTDKLQKKGVAEEITDNIAMYDDGKLRWKYELQLFRTPLIFLTVWLILFGVLSAGFGISFLVDMGKENFFWKGFLEWLRFYGYFVGGMTLLCGVGYAIYAGMMGGVYRVIFEMDEGGIKHSQIESDAKKAKKISEAAGAVGLASGNVTAMGIAANADRTEMYTDFGSVRRVVFRPMWHLVKLNAPFNHNQIYVHPADYEYVRQYITEHCPSAKIKGKNK